MRDIVISGPNVQTMFLDNDCSKKSQMNMAWHLPPLNALRDFEAAGRLGSFTKAAEELNVTHSAVSRHVRGLEKHLNVHLFRTQNSGVALTDQGHSYLAKITPAFDQIAEATELLTVPPEGVVSLTVESTVAQKWLVPRLSNLKKRHPNIDLRLSIETQIMDIAAHDFDIGLRYLREPPHDGHDFLFPSIVRAYAAPGFAPMKDNALELDALARGPLIEQITFGFWHE